MKILQIIVADKSLGDIFQLYEYSLNLTCNHLLGSDDQLSRIESIHTFTSEYFMLRPTNYFCNTFVLFLKRPRLITSFVNICRS